MLSTVIMEPANVESMSRAPSAPTPNKRGHWFNQSLLIRVSISTNTLAKSTLKATIKVGTNQKLERRSPHSFISLFMVNLPIPLSGKHLKQYKDSNIAQHTPQHDEQHRYMPIPQHR